jgi:hypothetical protein
MVISRKCRLIKCYKYRILHPKKSEPQRTKIQTAKNAKENDYTHSLRSLRLSSLWHNIYPVNPENQLERQLDFVIKIVCLATIFPPKFYLFHI